MTRRCLLLSVLFFAAIHISVAQEVSNKLRLQSISSVGLLNGSNGTAVALQTILGVTHKKSFAGLGVGLDYYRYRTIPLFVDLRHEFGKGGNEENMFLYGDIGYNYDWLVEGKLDQVNSYLSDNRFSGGLYYDVGIGGKFRISKHDALLISGGYTFKKLKSETGTGYCPIIGPCNNAIQTYRYYLSRLVMKVGWRF